MRTASKRAQAAPDTRTVLRDMQVRVTGLHLEAVESTLPAKAERTFRQWFSHNDPDDVRAAAAALALAMELEAVTPSHTGSTAVDRLARRRQLDPDEQAAFRALKGARFTPFTVGESIGDDVFSAEDLATRRRFVLFDDRLAPQAIGIPLIAWLCALDGETQGTVGLVMPLDGAALAVALDFVRPGKGIAHGHRCAAAVYRHIVRHGGPIIPGLTELPDLDDEEEEEEAEYERTPLDRLVGGLVADGTVLDLTPDLLDEARRLVSVDAILDALFKASGSAGLGLVEVGARYRRCAEVMIEALYLRALAGSGVDRTPLDTLAAALDREVATNGYPRIAADLFREIRRSVTAVKPKTGQEDLTRVIERIRALRAKTIDQGCTEEEALAAANKVAELLDRYGLTLGEIELRQQACLGLGIDSKRKRAGALDRCLPAVAQFCDCRCWHERTPEGTIRSMFFGLPADVEAAHYLYERVVAAFETETLAFQKGDAYRAEAGEGRKQATTSFQLGLSRGIEAKLQARKTERDEKTFKASGRDLVPVKESIVEDELAKLGLSFTSKSSLRSQRVAIGAYEAGQRAAGRFEIQSELERDEGEA